MDKVQEQLQKINSIKSWAGNRAREYKIKSIFKMETVQSRDKKTGEPVYYLHFGIKGATKRSNTTLCTQLENEVIEACKENSVPYAHRAYNFEATFNKFW